MLYYEFLNNSINIKFKLYNEETLIWNSEMI